MLQECTAASPAHSPTSPLPTLALCPIRSFCDVLSRWEEEELPAGTYWRTLQHRGPFFAPPYQPLPEGVHLLYEGPHLVSVSMSLCLCVCVSDALVYSYPTCLPMPILVWRAPIFFFFVVLRHWVVCCSQGNRSSLSLKQRRWLCFTPPCLSVNMSRSPSSTQTSSQTGRG